MQQAEEQDPNIPSAARRLTPAEIALMREIVKWRRDTAVDYWRWAPPVGRFLSWRASDRKVTVDFPAVDDPADGYAEVGYAHGWWASLTFFRARTLSEGVDVLVAFGYLPARFSSAYRAGYEVGLCHMAVGPGNVVPAFYAAEVPAVPRANAPR